MKDGRGEEIAVGDIVVYPVRAGSSMWMVEAIVTSIYSDGIQVERKRDYPEGYPHLKHRKVKLWNTNRVTKIYDNRQITLDELTAWVKRQVRVV